MRKMVLMLLAVLVIGLAGCARVIATQTLPNGIVYKYEYVRLGNQRIEGFSLASPNGWTIEFDKQLSEFEIAFNLGVLSARAGDGL